MDLMTTGYYDTWDQAWEACKKFLVGHDSGNFAVYECMCGKFYFWVRDD